MGNTLYVVTNGTQYLDWDDKGAMSTGYPLWVELKRAKMFQTRESAAVNAEAVIRCDKINVWVDRVTLVVSDRTPVTLPEQDPEWAEYQRLKNKFKGK